MYKFYPEPVSVKIYEGFLNAVSAFHADIDGLILAQCEQAGFSVRSAIDGLCTDKACGSTYRFCVNRQESLHAQGYHLLIHASGITIDAASGAGLY